MKFLTTATLDWFDDGCCDVKYLDMWQEAPLNYQPGTYQADRQAAGWQTDRHEVTLGHDEDGRLFHKAIDHLMRYQFYPPEIMNHTSDFGLHDRWVQVGDRIVQRIHILTLLGKPLLDVVTMTEVRQVVTDPRCYGFTYVTVDKHVEQGEWSAQINWRENGDVVLTIEAISRPVAAEPERNYKFMRRLQQKAHKRGLAHFQEIISA